MRRRVPGLGGGVMPFPSKFAPQPPMSTDPTVCRWCDGRMRPLFGDDGPLVCVHGCAPADKTPYHERCIECEREFVTGRKQHGFMCHGCTVRQDAALQRAYAMPTRSDVRWEEHLAVEREQGRTFRR